MNFYWFTPFIIVILLWLPFKIYQMVCRKGDGEWKIGVSVVGVIAMAITIMLVADLYSANQNTGKVEVSTNVPIISLENVSSTSGKFGGNLLGIGGSIKGSVSCNFVIEESDGIRIISEDNDDVVFHVTDGPVHAEKTHWLYINHYRINPKPWFYKNEYTWHVYIPKDAINRYIRFN